MKILLDHDSPFFLAHGGHQIQIEQTGKALAQIGVEVEYMRWWDESQRGDVIHFFGRPTDTYIGFAHRKGMSVVMGELLTAMGSRSTVRRWMQRTSTRLCKWLLPTSFTGRFSWESFRLADACIALTAWEKHLMLDIFGAQAARVHVVPNGVEQAFFDSPERERGPWLVCTATITPRKRVLELAEAAVVARTPVWVIGKPYAESDPYHRRFLEVAHAHREFVRFEGAINDRVRLAEVYREARGVVLLSTMESLSLTALEAAACECPLLLSDLPWARTVFGNVATYCPITGSVRKTAAALRSFYEAAPRLPVPPKPLSWIEVARKLQAVYESLPSASYDSHSPIA